MEKKSPSPYQEKNSHHDSKERRREDSNPRDRETERPRDRDSRPMNRGRDRPLEGERSRDKQNERRREIEREPEHERESHHSRFSKEGGDHPRPYNRGHSPSHSYSPKRSSSRNYHRPYYSSRDRPREREFRPRERFYHRNTRSPRVKYHRKTSRDNSSENKGNVLYVSNLSKRVNESDLHEKFERFGKIEEINIVKEPFTNESRGFGFITYEDPKSAQDAIAELNQTEYESKVITVEISKRAKPHKPTPGAYLGPKSDDYNRRRYERRERERDDYYSRFRSRSRSRRSNSRMRSRPYHRPSMSRSRSGRSRSRNRSPMYHSGRRYN